MPCFTKYIPGAYGTEEKEIILKALKKLHAELWEFINFQYHGSEGWSHFTISEGMQEIKAFIRLKLDKLEAGNDPHRMGVMKHPEVPYGNIIWIWLNDQFATISDQIGMWRHQHYYKIHKGTPYDMPHLSECSCSQKRVRNLEEVIGNLRKSARTNDHIIRLREIEINEKKKEIETLEECIEDEEVAKLKEEDEYNRMAQAFKDDTIARNGIVLEDDSETIDSDETRSSDEESEDDSFIVSDHDSDIGESEDPGVPDETHDDAWEEEFFDSDHISDASSMTSDRARLITSGWEIGTGYVGIPTGTGWRAEDNGPGDEFETAPVNIISDDEGLTDDEDDDYSQESNAMDSLLDTDIESLDTFVPPPGAIVIDLTEDDDDSTLLIGWENHN